MEEKLKDFLNQLLGFLTSEKVEIEVSQAKEGDLRVKIQLPTAAPLIGHRGENIYYLHYLTWLFLRRNYQFEKKLYLDINSYLEEKEEKLRQWAEKEIEKVISTGRPTSFYHLSAYERRLIHLVCAAHPEVESFSHDTPQGRVLTISPATDDKK